MIARQLLGKRLVTRVDNVITAGMIVETEAYSWRERGCHAYGGRKTARNASMFLPGGHAYVYFCYGLHHLVNVVTNDEGIAEAVLIRAVEPIEGIDTMRIRRNMPDAPVWQLTSGPARLTQAMGIDLKMNGQLLSGDNIWLEAGEQISPRMVETSCRIGIPYAREDAKLPWRFYIRGHACVSAK